ncbi:hypothetical protein D3C76_1666760 [compost metagenome]
MVGRVPAFIPAAVYPHCLHKTLRGGENIVNGQPVHTALEIMEGPAGFALRRTSRQYSISVPVPGLLQPGYNRMIRLHVQIPRKNQHYSR